MTQTSVSKLVTLTGTHAGEGFPLPPLQLFAGAILPKTPVYSKAKGTCLLSVRFHLKMKAVFKATVT